MNNKNKKIIVTIIIIILILVLLFSFGILIERLKTQKEKIKKMDVAISLQYQNRALWLSNNTPYRYLDYQKKREPYLYIALSCYYENTGEKVSLEDVQQFLSKEYNADGTPRTYKTDKIGKIREYVEWFDGDIVEKYKDELQVVLREYAKENDLDFIDLGQLNLEQIENLIKKKNDPSYKFELGDISEFDTHQEIEWTDEDVKIFNDLFPKSVLATT